MTILEFECKNCKHSFTRIKEDKKKNKKEKCVMCGGEAKLVREVDFKLGCSGCSACEGCEKKDKK